MKITTVVSLSLLACLALPRVQFAEPPGDPVNLIVDDGGADGAIGFAQEGLTFNRFSPTEFPLELDRVAVLWLADTTMQLGDPFWVFLYEDPDSDIPNGTTHRASAQGTVQVLDGVTFSFVDLDPPVTFSGPGDILIALGQTVYPNIVVPFDVSTPQERSWVVDWDGSMPPPIPSTGLGFFFDLNWMIRGFGTVLVPVELQSFSVE
jgi:hypothetical protein